MIFVKLVLGSILVILIGVPLYSVPATLSLPAGPRPGVEELTIEDAAKELNETALKDWQLVEAARALVAERMQYSRRNSFDSAERAFARGYGYCIQHAYALTHLLSELGFNAKVVQSFRNKFPDGQVTSHAWVSVSIEGENRYIDSLFYNAQENELGFTPLSEVTDVSPALKMLTFWGATSVNAHRYYLTGKDL